MGTMTRTVLLVPWAVALFIVYGCNGDDAGGVVVPDDAAALHGASPPSANEAVSGQPDAPFAESAVTMQHGGLEISAAQPSNGTAPEETAALTPPAPPVPDAPCIADDGSCAPRDVSGFGLLSAGGGAAGPETC